MKLFIRDRDLLRLGITWFATKFISIESLIRYEQDLKRMCTTTEWREFNKGVEEVCEIRFLISFWLTGFERRQERSKTL